MGTVKQVSISSLDSATVNANERLELTFLRDEVKKLRSMIGVKVSFVMLFRKMSRVTQEVTPMTKLLIFLRSELLFGKGLEHLLAQRFSELGTRRRTSSHPSTRRRLLSERLLRNV